MCGNAGMREQFGSDALAAKSRVNVHLTDMQAGRTWSLTKDEAHRPRWRYFCDPQERRRYTGRNVCLGQWLSQWGGQIQR